VQPFNLSQRNFVYSYIGWWIGWTVLQVLALQVTLQIGWDLAIYDALIDNLMLAVEVYIMISVMRVYQPRPSLMMVWSIAMAVTCTWGTVWIISTLFPDNDRYLQFVDQSIYLRCLFSWFIISFMSITSRLWFRIRDMQESEARKKDTEQMAREAELSKLRLQLQPHFLFNSLNSISALAGSRPEEARKMIQQLSDFLRGTIRQDDQQLVSLQDELKHLQLYLDIEKVRFGHRLQTEITCDAAALTLKLPVLLLQPMVENAIKFGLYDTTGEITIRLQASSVEGNLVLQVENPFDPDTAQPRQGTGFGLSSLQRRLYLLYARQDLLSTTQEGDTFIAQVTIPQTTA